MVLEPNPKKFRHLEVSGIGVGIFAWEKKKGLARQAREKSSEDHIVDAVSGDYFKKEGVVRKENENCSQKMIDNH